jgi:sodium-dependent dicarboxylate transporter 2/3/5
MKSVSKKWMYFLLAIILAVVGYWIVPSAANPKAPIMAAIVIVMAVCWIFEVLPIAVTSLFPMFLFPLFGILDAKDTAVFYGKEIIFLFLGGLMLAQGIQQSNLHQRLALRIVSIIGSKPAHLILGFMITTAFLSMWISNTATVMVMMPIGISIIEELKTGVTNDNKKLISRFAVALMLCIAYAADIGGMATVIGTMPNMIFIEMYQTIFPDKAAIGFTQWMMMGLPIAISFIITGWLLLTKIIYRMPKDNLLQSNEVVKSQLHGLGKITRDEALSGLVFFMAAVLWITGSDLRLSETITIQGWRTVFGLEMATDATIAIAAATLLFLIPSKQRQGEMLLKWSHVHSLPWGVLLLFGGGFAIAGGFSSSGLSDVVGNLFAQMTFSSPLVMVVVVCVVLTLLTEVTSNTATTNLVLPILAQASIALDIEPILLMIPATLSASCAFMMPVASPTQAIIFGSGYVKIKQMIRAGILFNLLGVIIVTTVFMLLSKFVFGV